MFYEIEPDLILDGFDIDPTQISKILLLSPTQVWLKGESIQKTALKRKSNGWVLSSRLEKSAELEDHINALFSKIKPVLLNFHNLPSQQRKSCLAQFISTTKKIIPLKNIVRHRYILSVSMLRF